jgi:hypothetical protein
VEPLKVGYAYPTLVPQVDADGNDLGGIRLPEIVAPLATYTGWNLRTAEIGAAGERLAFLGSFAPLPKTAAEAEAAHDSRLPVEARYKSDDEYRAQFERALDGLVSERFILAEDAPHLSARSREEWKSIVDPAGRPQ